MNKKEMFGKAVSGSLSTCGLNYWSATVNGVPAGNSSAMSYFFGSLTFDWLAAQIMSVPNIYPSTSEYAVDFYAPHAYGSNCYSGTYTVNTRPTTPYPVPSWFPPQPEQQQAPPICCDVCCP